MMNLYKYLLLICCFTLVSFTTKSKEHEKTKNINKTYAVHKNATVYVNNKYGNISIATWNQNKVEISVRISVKGSDISKVEDKLDAINIKFENSQNLIEARTLIEKTNSSWSWWGNSSKVDYKINYFIKMPKTNNADLHNKYGNIDLNELDGKTNIKCDYGNIQIDNLANETNTIELNYCGDSEIGSINCGYINADYSKISINKCKNIKSEIDYTSLKIKKVNNLSFSSDYGDVTVNEAKSISGNSDYSKMKFGTIHENLSVKSKYGSIRINNIVEGFKNVNINSRYAGIKIGTIPENNFNFNINLSYAEFNYPKEKINLFKAIKESTKKQYEGTYGNKESGSLITIKSEYGGVSFNLNDDL